MRHERTKHQSLRQTQAGSLRRAVAGLLVELVRLAHDCGEEYYQPIVNYATRYGYEKLYGAWQGDGPIRTALNEAALHCGSTGHEIIAKAVQALIKGNELEGRPGWYFHDLRTMLQNLLINPVCEEPLATDLGAAVTRVNEASH